MHSDTREDLTSFEVYVLWHQSCVPEGMELTITAEVPVFIWGGNVSSEKTKCSTFPYLV